jgi:hypothetical protein
MWMDQEPRVLSDPVVGCRNQNVECLGKCDPKYRIFDSTFKSEMDKCNHIRISIFRMNSRLEDPKIQFYLYIQNKKYIKKIKKYVYICV